MTAERIPRATLDDVAALAGVSKATASKVLNKRPSVASGTRQRVQQAMATLGYVPSTGPRDTSARSTVNLVFDSMISVYSMQVLDGVLTAAGEAGIDIVVDLLNPPDVEPPLSDGWFARLAEHGHLGVLVSASALPAEQVAAAQRLRLPMVAIDPIHALEEGVVSVAATNFIGGTQATHHLLELGHRRIGFAGLPSHISASRERFHGYRNALELAGVEFDPELVQHRGHTPRDGLQMASDFLALEDPATAVFAASDGTALGVLEAARLAGKRVPSDLSVVGFDDTYAAQWTSPGLTTVHQPIAQMGRVALRTLLNLARGEAPDSRHVQLATSLVLRGSTGPLPVAA